MSLLSEPAWLRRLDEPRAWVWAWLLRLGCVAGGYVAAVGLVFLLEQAGAAVGVRGLGIVGLAVDTLVLAGLALLLGRWGRPEASALGPLLALLCVVLLFAVADWGRGFRGNFWSVDTVQTTAVQTATVALAALGMIVIIIGGGIDLSAGVAVALSATVLALCLDRGLGLPVALAACVLTGCLAGAINGSLVSLLRVAPFIVTLSTMSAYLGIAKLLADETTVRPDPKLIPSWLKKLVTRLPEPAWLAWPLLPNFANGVWLTLGLAVWLAGTLQFTVFGRQVFALGSNEAAARLCGVRTRLLKVGVYALAGVFVGLAGVLSFARLSVGNPTSGVGLELRIIAAVVIGGASLSGGRGSVVGVLTGAALMSVIDNGCSALEMPNSIEDVATGALILGAVTLDQWRQRRMQAGV